MFVEGFNKFGPDYAGDWFYDYRYGIFSIKGREDRSWSSMWGYPGPRCAEGANNFLHSRANADISKLSMPLPPTSPKFPPSPEKTKLYQAVETMVDNKRMTDAYTAYNGEYFSHSEVIPHIALKLILKTLRDVKEEIESLIDKKSANTAYSYDLDGKKYVILPLHLACVTFTKLLNNARVRTNARINAKKRSPWGEKDLYEVDAGTLKCMFQIIQELAISTLPENLFDILSAEPYNAIDPAVRRVLFQYLNARAEESVALKARQLEDNLSAQYRYEKITGDDFFDKKYLQAMQNQMISANHDEPTPRTTHKALFFSHVEYKGPVPELFYATYQANVEKVIELLKNGADANEKYNNKTPLHQACLQIDLVGYQPSVLCSIIRALLPHTSPENIEFLTKGEGCYGMDEDAYSYLTDYVGSTAKSPSH